MRASIPHLIVWLDYFTTISYIHISNVVPLILLASRLLAYASCVGTQLQCEQFGEFFC